MRHITTAESRNVSSILRASAGKKYRSTYRLGIRSERLGDAANVYMTQIIKHGLVSRAFDGLLLHATGVQRG
jgi:hypothetical protein